MYLALDIGTEYTYIVCWEEDQPVDDVSLKVRIPGLGIYHPPVTLWDRQNWHQHIAFFFREYLLPTRRPINSVSIALPGIPDLTSRRMLLDIFEEVMGLADAEIIARPLGLLSGWSRDLPQRTIGDVMLIEVQNGFLTCSLLSVFADGRMILEKTVEGNREQLEAAGRKCGFYTASGWALDYIMITGEDHDSFDLTTVIASIDHHTKVLQASEPGWKTIAGLYQRKRSREKSPWFMIYPYDFYLESKLSEPNSKLKMAFDTTNLELAVDGNYLLARIDPDQYSVDNDASRIQVRVWEAPHSQPLNINWDSQRLVLDIDSCREDLPEILNLHLNLDSAGLALELPDENGSNTASVPSPQPDLTQTNLENLYQNLAAKSDIRDLYQAFHTFNTSYPSDPNLAEEIKFCLFHLYGLLAIYSL